MTEIERILQKGIIKGDFLREEVRNDFLVTTERKKLWAIILDMFFEFQRVCKKYDLMYYPIAGFLLGAIRHKGYIPWDDDLDVVMPRDDYEKFLQLKNEFKSPYFFQIPETDEGYYYGMAKIRNSNTTALNQKFKYAGFNQGIWFSVFPLDNWRLDGGEERFERIKKHLMDCGTYMRRTNPYLDERDLARVQDLGDKDPYQAYKDVQHIASQFCKEDTSHVALATCTVYKYEKNIFKKKDFEYAIPWKFEGYDIVVPVGYESILKTAYGDFMQFPPVENRGNWHAGTFFDSDKPYTHYINQLQETL